MEEGSTENLYLDCCSFLIRSTFSQEDKSIIICYVLVIKTLDCVTATLKRTRILLGLLRQRATALVNVTFDRMKWED